MSQNTPEASNVSLIYVMDNIKLKRKKHNINMLPIVLTKCYVYVDAISALKEMHFNTHTLQLVYMSEGLVNTSRDGQG